MYMIISSNEQHTATSLHVTQQQANKLISQISQFGGQVRIQLEPDREELLAEETARGEYSEGYEVRR